MKLGEIKIEALKLMFVNNNSDITIDELNLLGIDESYGEYLVNMPGAINRCFSSLEEKGVLPIKAYELLASNGVTSGIFMKFDLATLIDDYFDIERLTYTNNGGEYIGDYGYQREGEIILISDFSEEDTYTVLYTPKLERVTASTDNDLELDIPDNIAAHIPYFIKGDLFRSDEPNEASEARNWYEAAMNAIVASKQKKVSKVVSIYDQTE